MRAAQKDDAGYSIDSRSVPSELLVGDAQGLLDYNATQAVADYHDRLIGGLEEVYQEEYEG